jgi:hypothetical protein
MRIGEEMQRKEEEQRITQIYTQISVMMGNNSLIIEKKC